MSKFHERLKELRYSKALTQESFAKIGGVTINTQVNYEKGERFPNADYLMRLAKEDFDVNYLLTGKRIRNKLHFEQGQLLDFYDEANTDVRAAVFDLFMIEQSGEPLRQTLLYRQNVLEYLTGHRKYGELSQEEMELLHLWHKTPWHMRKAVLNMLATDWFEEEPKNYKAEDSSGGSSSQGGDSGRDSETVTASRRDKDGQSSEGGEGGDPEAFFKVHRDKTDKTDTGMRFFMGVLLLVLAIVFAQLSVLLFPGQAASSPQAVSAYIVTVAGICMAAIGLVASAMNISLRNSWLLLPVYQWCRYNLIVWLWRNWRGDADGEGRKAKARIDLWHAFNDRETAKERYHIKPTKRRKSKMERLEARWQEMYHHFLAEYGYCAPCV